MDRQIENAKEVFFANNKEFSEALAGIAHLLDGKLENIYTFTELDLPEDKASIFNAWTHIGGLSTKMRIEFVSERFVWEYTGGILKRVFLGTFNLILEYRKDYDYHLLHNLEIFLLRNIIKDKYSIQGLFEWFFVKNFIKISELKIHIFFYNWDIV